jgi:hypothetical protein
MQYFPGEVMPMTLATSEFAGSCIRTSPFQLRENCAPLQTGHELPVTKRLQFLQTFSFVVIWVTCFLVKDAISDKNSHPCRKGCLSVVTGN